MCWPWYRAKDSKEQRKNNNGDLKHECWPGSQERLKKMNMLHERYPITRN